MKVKNGYLILTKVYSSSPELENNPLEASFVQLPDHSVNVKVANFNLALARMDAGNGLENIPSGSPLFIYGQEAYAGQRNGQHVSVGTHVHCNRFNGRHSDHRYWKHSDVLNTRGHRVHNCSSWRGGRAHKNWPKTESSLSLKVRNDGVFESQKKLLTIIARFCYWLIGLAYQEVNVTHVIGHK